MKEFMYVFQLSKTVVFEVEYYTLSTNKNAHFTTSASHFNRPKTDYDQCGQAQNDLTKNCLIARNFWKKWDEKHLKSLTDNEYQELMQDIEKLKATYNYIYKELDETKKPYSPHIPFYAIKELSKMKLPNSRNKPQQYIY